MKKRKVLGMFAVLLILLVGHRGLSQTTCYPKAPNPIAGLAEAIARDIVKHRKEPRVAEKVDNALPRLVLYTVMDAAVGLTLQGPLSTKDDFEHLGETARTDKQLGPSAKANGSSSLIEKPGFAQLLGFSIDHGAIKQSINGTTFTLSTSPYAFIVLAAGGKDTAQLYQNAGFLNRLGASATFNIANQNDLLSNVNRKDLTEWSVRARLTGDRSARSKAFGRFWTDKIAPSLQNRLNITTQAEQDLINGINGVKSAYVPLIDPNQGVPLRARIADYLGTHQTTPDDQAVADIKEMILCTLSAKLYDPIKKNQIVITQEDQQKIKSQVLPALARSDQDIAEARNLLESEINSFNSRPELTLEYTNHRDSMSSDYSELKLLFQEDTRPLKVTANGGFSLYNHPNAMMNQQRLRDYSVALSAEGTAPSPFTTAADLSKVTYSFSGSYERLKENEHIIGRTPDIGSVQLKVEIPIALGLSIPVAYTYSTATEMMKKGENKFNVGLHLDMDKLYSIIRGQKQ
jgi:hypothetical protein